MDKTITETMRVRRFLQEDGRLFVSFREHDGYFELTEPAHKALLSEALQTGQSVCITATADLHIVAAVRSWRKAQRA